MLLSFFKTLQKALKSFQNFKFIVQILGIRIIIANFIMRISTTSKATRVINCRLRIDQGQL